MLVIETSIIKQTIILKKKKEKNQINMTLYQLLVIKKCAVDQNEMFNFKSQLIVIKCIQVLGGIQPKVINRT